MATRAMPNIVRLKRSSAMAFTAIPGPMCRGVTGMEA